MESALSETRSKYFQSKENGSPLSSPIIQFISSSIPNSHGNLDDPSVLRSDVGNNGDKYADSPSRVVRSLFREDPVVAKRNDLSESRRILDGQPGSVGDLTIENEFLVNEFLHQQNPFSDSLGMSEAEDQNSIQVCTFFLSCDL